MKSLIVILIYLLSFFGIYFLLSVGISLMIGESILQNIAWIQVYSSFIGWWVSVFPAREYYMKNEQHFL